MDEKLPEGWTELPLHELAELIRGVSYGKSFARDREMKGYLPILRATNIQNDRLILDDDLIFIPQSLIQDEQLLKLEDIVICMSSGSKHLVGKTAQLTQNWKGSIGVFCGVVRFISILNKRFFGYYFNSSIYRNYISEKSSGVNINNLRHADLEGLLLPLPPLPEQNRIVAAIEQQFTRLDNAIASLHSAKARIKQFRASLLKAAVEGELTKEWRAEHPNEETGTQLLARILIERRTRWEEEQLAKMREKPKNDEWKQTYKEPQGPDVEQLLGLPEGWCWATMEQVITYLRNGLPQKPEVSPPGYRILRINAVRPMKVDLDEVRYLSIPEAEARDYLLDNGDVLFTRYNGSLDLLGVAGVVKGCSEPTLHPDKLIRVKTVLKDTLPLYIEIVCNVGTSRAFIESRARTTAGQKGISGSDVKQMPIPLPPLSEQEQIVTEVEVQLSNIAQMEETIEASLKRAEHERQSILREAFAGRLVPQDFEDEPANVLLERIGEERKKHEEAEKVKRASRKGVQMTIVRKQRTGKASLYTTLVEAARPLPPDDLFKRAGLKVDEQHESAEAFYEELHADVEDALIEETRSDDGHVLLNALEPSAEILARMMEEKVVTRASEAQQSEKAIDAPRLWNME